MRLFIYNVLIIIHLQKSAIHLYRNQRLTVATSFTIEQLTLSVKLRTKQKSYEKDYEICKRSFIVS